MAHDVFISYSTPNKAVADAACAVLEQEKIRCWIAPRDITAGRTYGAEIDAAIEGSRAVIVVVSAGAVASRYVTREVELAVHYGRPIVPLKIEDIPLAGDLKFFLNSIHWLDAVTPPVERHLQALARVVRRLLDGEEWERLEGVRPPEDQKGRLLRGLASALACLVALPTLAGLVLRVAPFWPSRPGVVLFTIFVNLLVLGWSYTDWQSSTPSRLRVHLARAAAGAGAFLLIYLILYAGFVWDAPTPDEPEVGGFLLRAPIVKLLNDDPAMTIQDALDGSEDRPFNVWVPWTVVVARVGLLASWLGLSGCLSVVTTILALGLATRAMRLGVARDPA